MPPEKQWAVPGRLLVNCLELDDVKGKDDKLKAYVCLQLGKEEGGDKKRTKTKSADETGRDVVIGENFVYDVTDPNTIKQDDEIELEITVYDDNWTDTLLCFESVKLKHLVFLDPFNLQDVWFDLKVAGDDDLNGRIRLELLWEPASTGLLRITLNSATGLADGGLLDVDKNDPYVQASLGKGFSVRSSTQDDAGAVADFQDEEMLIWVDEKNWMEPLVFTVFDDNLIKDAFLGERFVSHVHHNFPDCVASSSSPSIPTLTIVVFLSLSLSLSLSPFVPLRQARLRWMRVASWVACCQILPLTQK